MTGWCIPSSKCALYKNENGYRQLAEVDFNWDFAKTYTITVEARGANYAIYVDGKLRLEYEDQHSPYLYGQIGFSNWGASHSHYKGFKVKGIQ